MGAGGRRDGSGRKAMHPDDKKVQLTITISPESYAKIKRLKSDYQINFNDEIEWLVDYLTENLYKKEELQ